MSPFASPLPVGSSVRAPASTSNLGPGFDLLGLALGLYLEVEVVGASAGADEIVAREGEALGWPRDADDLVLRALSRARLEAGTDSPGLALRARSEVPVGRGFGSSGAAVAAGLALGDALARAGGAPPLSRSRLLALGLELEGHPDNVTAALLGGCTLALPLPEGLEVVHHPVHPAIGFVLAWPATPFPTAAARAVLPRSVPFADAVENPRRLAFLLAGLAAGSGRWLRLGGEDRLHVAHRLPRLPGAADAMREAHAAGAWLATLSGSGSGLVAAAPHERTEAVAEAMRRVLERVDPPAGARVVEPVLEAAEWRPPP